MMQALVKTKAGPGGVELLAWKERAVAPDEVKIEVAYSGICGTDLEILKGTWPCSVPVVLGHEFSGTVAEVGSEVKSIAAGDRVVAGNPAQTCGLCFHCRAGNPTMCRERSSIGYMIDGSFAKYIVVKRDTVHKVPDNVGLREAALCEPMTVAIRAVMEQTSVQAGDNVLISGPGPIGLLTVGVAKAHGAKTITCGIGLDERRLACARALGSDVVVDVSKEDVVQAVQDATSGVGVDIAVECAGAPDSLNVCLQAVRRGGTVVQVGIFHPATFEADFNRVVLNEVKIIGVYGRLWASWEKSLALIADGKVRTDLLISHELPLSEWEEAFRLLESGEGIKVLLRGA